MWRVQRPAAMAAAFLLVAVLLATGAQGKKYCNDLECPDYKVVDDLGSGVQLRRYDAATWATTDVDDRSYEKATTLGFHRLFRYIIGDNELEQRIDMTAPVVTTIRLDDHREFTDDYSVSFFLPYEYQCSKDRKDVRAPKPHDDRVKLVDLKRFDAYVLTFDGYALGFRVKRLAEDLFDFLDRKGCRDYSSHTLFVATYDPPFKIIDRRNEIWLLRKGRKDEQPDVATA